MTDWFEAKRREFEITIREIDALKILIQTLMKAGEDTVQMQERLARHIAHAKSIDMQLSAWGK